ncbi:MAG TPA: thiocillin family RiPP [Longimicrobium sp.]|nr:thiocillin family RiPP [Longimicrobium sp.]
MTPQDPSIGRDHPLDLEASSRDLDLLAADASRPDARRRGCQSTFSSFGTLGSIGGTVGTAGSFGCVFCRDLSRSAGDGSERPS